MTKRSQFKGFLLGCVVAFAVPALAATFNLFSPANGILVGNPSTYVTTAATSSNVIGLWSGTCNGTTVLKGDGTCGALSAGTVTSVGLTMPSGFSVSGSPVTSSGTLGVTTTLNGPVRGNGSGLITGNTSLTTEVSGILPVANGGTGVGTLTGPIKGNGTSAFSAAAAADIYGLWSGTCNNTTFLRGDGSCASPGGGGTVTSVGLAAPAIFTVTNSPVTGSGTLTLSYSGSALPVANGGTGVTTSTGTGSVVLSASPALTGSPTVGGQNICLANGTNCPAASLGFKLVQCLINGTAGGAISSVNASSCTRAITGTYTVNFNSTFAANPSCVATTEGNGVNLDATVSSISTSSVQFQVAAPGGTLTDATRLHVICVGP